MAPRRVQRSTLWKFDRQAAFLKAFAKVGSVSEAAEIAGIEPHTHWFEWLADPVYKEKFEPLRALFADELEREATRRALGWNEPVYQGGIMVGNIRRHSDALLQLLLRGNLRAKYSERVEAHNLNANLNATVQTPIALDVTKLTEEELRVFTTLLLKAESVAGQEAENRRPGGALPAQPS
jgi:hypothetical protein